MRTTRNGLARGFKQIGGIGLTLPTRLRRGHPSAEEAFLRGLPLSGMTVYDVGAFRGALTLFFASRTGASGHVVAFEPHPHSHDRILAHLELNGVTNVTVRNVAVGAEAGSLDLASTEEGDATTTANEGMQRGLQSRGLDLERFTVPLVSIDGEAERGELPAPDFVKIDVEGMEHQVLRGMRKTIEKRKPKLYIEMHGAGAEAKWANAQAVVGLLVDSDYSLHHVESDRAVDVGTAGFALEGHLFCE